MNETNHTLAVAPDPRTMRRTLSDMYNGSDLRSVRGLNRSSEWRRDVEVVTSTPENAPARSSSCPRHSAVGGTVCKDLSKSIVIKLNVIIPDKMHVGDHLRDQQRVVRIKGKRVLQSLIVSNNNTAIREARLAHEFSQPLCPLLATSVPPNQGQMVVDALRERAPNSIVMVAVPENMGRICKGPFTEGVVAGIGRNELSSKETVWGPDAARENAPKRPHPTGIKEPVSRVLTSGFESAESS